MIQISEATANQIKGILWMPNCNCNPVKDALGRYAISEIEAQALNIEGPEFEFIPIPTDQPIPIM